jgi:DNA-binding FrmR family transcriptional regulator
VAGYSASRRTHQNRLNRIEGQIRGIARMVDEDRYCIDILTQVAAVSRALQSFALELLDDHLDHCLPDEVGEEPAERQRRLKEASGAIARLVRS